MYCSSQGAVCRLALMATVAVGFRGAPTWALSSMSPSSPGQSRSPIVQRRQAVGRITSLDRSKLDTVPDSQFHRQANLVTHTDDAFIERLRQLYQNLFLSILSDSKKTNDNCDLQSLVLLDLMSSHVSHLPALKTLGTQPPRLRVDVHGMNAQELTQNEARARTGGSLFVRDLNDNPSLVGLCDTDSKYDAVLCCAGIQYLQEAEAVLAEVARVLKPGSGQVIISFTNRFFYQKAIQGWINRGMKERARLVQDYLRAAGGFENIQVMGVWKQVQSLAGLGGDPFVAVVATRCQE